MRQFFQGWRRKTGVVTLVMTLAVVVGWIRSSLLYDFVGLHIGRFTSYTVISEGHWVGIQYSYTGGAELANSPRRRLIFWGTGKLTRRGHSDLLTSSGIAWTRQWWIFEVGENAIEEFQLTGYQLRIWLIPYWLLAMPLTILSAYLLLWKPRQRRSCPT